MGPGGAVVTAGAKWDSVYCRGQVRQCLLQGTRGAVFTAGNQRGSLYCREPEGQSLLQGPGGATARVSPFSVTCDDLTSENGNQSLDPPLSWWSLYHLATENHTAACVLARDTRMNFC